MALGEGMHITEKRLRGMKAWGRRLRSESRREKIHVGGEPCGNNRKQRRHDPEQGQDQIREKLNVGPMGSTQNTSYQF